MNKPKIITVVGPTASGKTSLGVFLCKKFDGEIISADSRQVYRGLDLGTGKEGLRKENRKKKIENGSGRGDPVGRLEIIKQNARWIDDVPQYLIDVRNPEQKFNVHDFKTESEKLIEDILARDRVPFIVGGTGLYVDALVENYDFGGRDNKKKNPPKFDVLQIGIKVPRDELHQRIDERVGQRVEEGMVREVKELLDKGVNPQWLISLGLEYKYLTEHLTGKIPDLDQALQELKYAIHAFARRQETWFRHHGNIEWISKKEEAIDLIKEFI